VERRTDGEIAAAIAVDIAQARDRPTEMIAGDLALYFSARSPSSASTRVN
jgi:hypothetical protein